MNSIYTFGYRKKTIAELSKCVTEINAVIFDCRYNPFVKSEDWSKSGLEIAFQNRYKWVKEFGNVLYKTNDILLNDLKRGLDKFEIVFKKNIPVILLCCCEKSEYCHRLVVAKHISKKFDLEIVNIGEKIQLKLF